MFLQRCWFSLCQGWRYRHTLAALRRTALTNVTSLEVESLSSEGVRVLALDFDGVLAAHASPEPDQDVKAWLHELSAAQEFDKICILSNKPNENREAFFKAHYPEILFIRAPRKKPYPDGLHEIASQCGVSPAAIALVDDRLLTGVLATVLAGAKCVYLYPARRDLIRRPIRESFFTCLRVFERLVISLRIKF